MYHHIELNIYLTKKQAKYLLLNNENNDEIVIYNIEFDIAVKIAPRLDKLKAFL
jgi:hypothetical protein